MIHANYLNLGVSISYYTTWNTHALLRVVAKLKRDRVHRVIKEASRHRDTPICGGCCYFMSFAELPIALFIALLYKSGLAKSE